MNAVILAPFHYVACPRLDLSLPDLSKLPGVAIFAAAMISYYLIISGIVFDIIRSPPPWGARRDEHGNIVSTIAPIVSIYLFILFIFGLGL